MYVYVLYMRCLGHPRTLEVSSFPFLPGKAKWVPSSYLPYSTLSANSVK